MVVGVLRVEAVDSWRVSLPLRAPFAAAHGSLATRVVLLVRVRGAGGLEGWGECGALPEPTYTEEWVAGAALAVREHLAPRLLAAGDVAAADAPAVMAGVAGHRMAKAALETALLDAELRHAGRCLAAEVASGAVPARVAAGVAVGRAPSLADLAEEVAGLAAAGYRRVKVKIAPGWDRAPLQTVRDVVGPATALLADANGSYDPDDPAHEAALASLDGLGLSALEQPYPPDALLAHARLAARLATPVALDETLVSTRVLNDALALGACSVVCVKAARMGGVAAARTALDLAAAAGAGAYVGGVYDTGLARRMNLALATHPGSTLPGDHAASAHFFTTDLAPPVTVSDGWAPVPTDAGVAPPPDPDVLATFGTPV